jgi:hypothetical protein
MTRTAAPSLLAIPVLVALLSTSPARAAEQPPLAPGMILTVAGTAGTAGFSGDGSPATNARLDSPWGLAIDAAANLLIGDLDNARLRRVSLDDTITTVSGGQPGFASDGDLAAKARFAEVTHRSEEPAAGPANSRLCHDGMIERRQGCAAISC